MNTLNMIESYYIRSNQIISNDISLLYYSNYIMLNQLNQINSNHISKYTKLLISSYYISIYFITFQCVYIHILNNDSSKQLLVPSNTTFSTRLFHFPPAWTAQCMGMEVACRPWVSNHGSVGLGFGAHLVAYPPQLPWILNAFVVYTCLPFLDMATKKCLFLLVEMNKWN